MYLLSMRDSQLLNETKRIKELMGVKEGLIDDIKSFFMGKLTSDDKDSKENTEETSEIDVASKNKISSPLCGTSNEWYVTSPFGVRNFRGKKQNHPAVDLAANYVEVRAPFDGVIDNASGFGKADCGGMLIINNKENGFSSKFCHMSEINTSKIGKPVKKGEIIGKTGGSSKDGYDKRGNSSDPHLHFEFKVNGKFVDPNTYLQKGFCPKPKK